MFDDQRHQEAGGGAVRVLFCLQMDWLRLLLRLWPAARRPPGGKPMNDRIKEIKGRLNFTLKLLDEDFIFLLSEIERKDKALEAAKKIKRCDLCHDQPLEDRCQIEKMRAALAALDSAGKGEL
jgi:hypothetical protein